VKHICAHLNAFHAYADDPSRFVETNHYCAHLSTLPVPSIRFTYSQHQTMTYANVYSMTRTSPTPVSSELSI
jgi:hypothetical protein